MKTQYYARAAIAKFTKADNTEVFTACDLVKITTAKALVELIANTAYLNGLGEPTIQLIPITREQFKKEFITIPADSLKR